MNCINENCEGTLKPLHTDSRQEWVEEYFECDGCNLEFCRRIEYDNNGLVIVDKIYEV